MLNQTILSGHLVSDPALRHTASDIPVTSFTIASQRDYATNGTKEADFIDVTAWRAAADFVSKYFRKGQAISVVGRLQSRTYTDKNGNKRKAVEIIAEHAYFAGGKKDGDDTARKETFPASTDFPEFDEMDEADGDLPF